MKIVVTGGRDKSSQEWVMLVFKVLGPLLVKEVFVGCADGIDNTVRAMYDWEEHVKLHVVEADWNKHGKAAGPIRNREMLLAAGKDAIVIAFPGGKGTENCVKTAKELGMIVLRVEV